MSGAGNFAARYGAASAQATTGADLLRQARHAFTRALALGFVVAAASNLVMLTLPLYGMALFNNVLNSRDTDTLFWLSVGLAFAMLVYGALEYVRALLYDAMAERVSRTLSLPALLAANRLADEKGPVISGEVIRDLGEVRSFVSGNAISIPLDLAWSPLMLAALFLMHWAYGAFAILCMLVLALLSIGADLLTRRALTEANAETVRSFAEISTALRNAEAVEGLGMIEALSRRWRRAQDRMLEKLWRATRTGKAFSATTKACRMLMTAGTVCLALVLTVNGEASSGSMVATNMILARLLLPFEQIMATWRGWVSAGAAWQRLRDCLSETRRQRGMLPLPCPTGNLDVDRLVYIPPHLDRPVLRGVSFRLEAGEVLGVIGPSGAGKSTLARLVVGAIEPTAGGVWLDGNSTWHWERADFGRYVGYMPQATTLFEGSIADNVARLRAAELGDIIGICRQVGIHEAIMRLPQGYATPIGEAGFTLSGGQRQRLALARALFGQPKLLVLDEPNSNLDEEGETVLLQAIATARKNGAAVLMIAHRPSLVTIADKLLVLKDGLVDRFGARQAVLRALSAPPIQLLHGPDAEDGAPRALSAAR